MGESLKRGKDALNWQNTHCTTSTQHLYYHLRQNIAISSISKGYNTIVTLMLCDLYKCPTLPILQNKDRFVFFSEQKQEFKQDSDVKGFFTYAFFFVVLMSFSWISQISPKFGQRQLVIKNLPWDLSQSEIANCHNFFL